MPSLRTGSLGLDILLGGGWKPGTINEIWGFPGTGKTTLAEHAIWELEPGQKALWLSMGTEIPHRPSGALVGQPRNAEQAFYIMDTAVRGDISLIVVDSANGLVRQAELDGDPGYTPHPQREYREELNGLKEGCKAHGAIVLFISKPRDRDREPVRGTGISEKSKDRVQLRLQQQHQDDTREILAQVRLGRDEFKTTAFTIVPGTGIDWATELFHLGIRYSQIRNNGSWYWIGYDVGYGTAFQRVQGVRQGAEFLRGNTQAAIFLDEYVRMMNHI